MKKMDEREIQENVIKMRYIEQHVEQMKQNTQQLSSIMLETATTIVTLKEMEKLKTEKESKIPLGSGVFTSVKISKQEEILMEVGEGIVVEKNIKEAIERLETREENIKKNIDQFQKTIQQMEQQYMESAQTVQEFRATQNQ